MNAVPMRRIEAPRRRAPGSRVARSERLGRFDRRRDPLQRRDGFAGVAEADAELEPLELYLVPRRRIAANVAALAVVLLGVLMLSAVVLHTRLAERQRQIDQLEQQVDVQHELFDILRQQRAVLRSPTRLASESCPIGNVRTAGLGLRRRRSVDGGPDHRRHRQHRGARQPARRW